VIRESFVYVLNGRKEGNNYNFMIFNISQIEN